MTKFSYIFDVHIFTNQLFAQAMTLEKHRELLSVAAVTVKCHRIEFFFVIWRACSCGLCRKFVAHQCHRTRTYTKFKMAMPKMLSYARPNRGMNVIELSSERCKLFTNTQSLMMYAKLSNALFFGMKI